MNVIDILAAGHLQNAIDMKVPLSLDEAIELAKNEVDNYIVRYNENKQFVVCQALESIFGTMYFIVKLYSPKELRGDGGVSKLIDECPTPLFKVKVVEHIRGEEVIDIGKYAECR